MAKIAQFLWKNFDVFLSLVAAIVVGILGWFSLATPEKVSASTLVILGVLALALWRNRSTDTQLREATEKLLDCLPLPPANAYLLESGHYREDMKKEFAQAKQVWILSRTCRMIWKDYRPQLVDKVLNENRGQVRLMLVDPRDGALEMIARTSVWDDAALNAKQLSDLIGSFLTSLCRNLHPHLSDGSLAVRTIDYLPPYTLYIINPQSSDGSGAIYVELASFPARPHGRPTLKLVANRDEPWYARIIAEYLDIWNSSEVTSEMQIKTDGAARQWELAPIKPGNV